MRKLGTVTLAALALALSTTLASSAWAGGFCTFGILCPPRAPEIDPNALRGAVAVLVGGVMMLAERRRRR